MAVAYLCSPEELAVLAHFSGERTLAGFHGLPAVGPEQSGALLAGLREKGMVLLSGGRVSVPGPLKLIMRLLASPALLVCSGGGVRAYCTADLGLLVTPAPHSGARFRILPFPAAGELAERLWEEAGIYAGPGERERAAGREEQGEKAGGPGVTGVAGAAEAAGVTGVAEQDRRTGFEIYRGTETGAGMMAGRKVRLSRQELTEIVSQVYREIEPEADGEAYKNAGPEAEPEAGQEGASNEATAD